MPAYGSFSFHFFSLDFNSSLIGAKHQSRFIRYSILVSFLLETKSWARPFVDSALFSSYAEPPGTNSLALTLKFIGLPAGCPTPGEGIMPCCS